MRLLLGKQRHFFTTSFLRIPTLIVEESRIGKKPGAAGGLHGAPTSGAPIFLFDAEDMLLSQDPVFPPPLDLPLRSPGLGDRRKDS